MLWSSAYIPAAASTPACRSPPPTRLRRRLTAFTRSRVEATSDPAGAPRPLLRQTLTVSAFSHHLLNDTPVATCAFHSRARRHGRVVEQVVREGRHRQPLPEQRSEEHTSQLQS